MTTDSNIPVRSPPNSPPAKRVKTDETISIANTITNTTTQDNNGAAVPVTKMSQTPRLLIKKLSEKARLPTRGSAFAAGYDIYASKATVIPARGKALVDTDISMAVSELEESVRGAGGFGSTGGFAAQIAHAVGINTDGAADGPSDAAPAAADEKPSS
ncbi:hypothetical protein VMCG_01416 [Cytospora schulzeri]|uniref:dUTP diphosphatase n=1 Tax=Cytospora schulzeri TaxID=448051 RepID=A0A423X6L9_9PEZI|nr:hypothetical protein VMCG_01416 [Valsa malicola]